MKETHKRTLVWAGVILAIVAIIVLVIMIPSSNNGNNTENSTLWIGNSPVLGSPNATVIIYEFSDFSCPFCAAAEGENAQVEQLLVSRMPGWEAPLPLIKENYVDTGKVKIIFKYYPGHGSAVAAHAVAMGINKQNPELFWKFAEKAFSMQSTANLNDLAAMLVLAKQIGADDAALSEYISSKEYETALKEDIDMGKNNKVEGTPAFFINGELISGAQPFSVFKEAIDKELG